jgi:hypothetical protein
MGPLTSSRRLACSIHYALLKRRILLVKRKFALQTLVALIMGLIFIALAGSRALPFDTGPHFDITRDALAAEGFGNTAIEVAQVTNFFNDLYENAKSNPYSGHAPWLAELVQGALGDQEHWPQVRWSPNSGQIAKIGSCS